MYGHVTYGCLLISYVKYTCVYIYIYIYIYSRGHEKIAITVQRSPFERRSAFTVHGNDVHF